MRFQSLSNNRGLSLLEVMISMVILSIGLLGLTPLMVLSIKSNNISNDTIIASNIARDKMEYLEGLDSIPSSSFSESVSNVQSGFNQTTIINDNSSDNTIPNGLLRVTIAIDWIDKTGSIRKTMLSSYIRKK